MIRQFFERTGEATTTSGGGGGATGAGHEDHDDTVT